MKVEALRKFQSAFLVTTATFVLLSCTNGKIARSPSSSLLGTSAAGATSVSSQPGTLSITNVLRDSLDPNGTFEIIDDGSGWIGNDCASNSGSGHTPCVCAFTYNQPDPNNPGNLIPEALEVSTTYTEGDMLRCPFSGIPSNVSQVNVSILVIATNQYSNSVTFNFNSGSGGVDMTQVTNYSQVYRYTCKDQVYIPDSMDLASGIYDPNLSESPNYSYPINFYTTNIGATVAAYAGGATGIKPVNDWNCPSNLLNPPSDFQVTLYSVNPLTANGSEVISGAISPAPPGPSPSPNAQGQADMNSPNSRSTFYLANVSSGVFNVPVNSYIAPTIISNSQGSPSDSGGGVPFLGYGASPISLSQQGTETCPSVAIPAGYQWVKVWLFRSALPARQFLYSNNLSQLADIGCNPGPWPSPVPSPSPTPMQSNPLNWTVPDCFLTNWVQLSSAQNYGGNCAGPVCDGNDNNATQDAQPPYAARFSHATGMCFNIFPGVAGSLQPTTFATGTDYWDPYFSPDPRTAVTQFQNVVDVNDCGSQTIQQITGLLNSCTLQNHSGGYNNYVTYDSSPQIGNLDNSQTRYEFLFVVTPTNVFTRDMQNQGSQILEQYTPYRFQTNTECNYNDPIEENQSYPNICNFNNSFRNYGLKLHDVANNGDPPANDPNRPGVFPVCAIQPVGLPQ